MTARERAAPENGIWLCAHCAGLIDRDVVTYTVSVLCQWKADAEERARRAVDGAEPLKQVVIATFRELCVELRPLLADNNFVFRSFGPKSSAGDDGVRWTLAMWESAKRKRIVPNNCLIADLLRKHDHLVPSEARTLVERMLAHIEAFAAHCQDPNFDYSEHRFPAEFSQLVRAYSSKPAETVSEMTRALEALLSDSPLRPKAGAVIGSWLSSSAPGDLDLVLLLSSEPPLPRSDALLALTRLRKEFQGRFGIPLHATTWPAAERSGYEAFLATCDSVPLTFSEGS